ncbi:unnamed protein product [Staurois parvus]|uniref:Uncharacterized protein n=1 Tax=Staurois parvus TaxID=386267 RepID=A0ABN9D0J9_9NEOB|nr:unnamed protein product [Staurois parvus]
MEWQDRYSCRRMLEYQAGYSALLCRRTCSSVQRCSAFTGCILFPAPTSSVWALGCDSLPGAHCACARSDALCEWPRVVYWDLPLVPQGYGEDNSAEVGGGTCQIWVPAPPASQRSSVSGHLLY